MDKDAAAMPPTNRDYKVSQAVPMKLHLTLARMPSTFSTRDAAQRDHARGQMVLSQCSVVFQARIEIPI